MHTHSYLDWDSLGGLYGFANARQDQNRGDAFVDYLLYRMSSGLDSVRGICEAALLACHTQMCSATLKKLAKCGTWMHHPQNCERDLHKYVQSYLPLKLEKYYAPIRIDVGDQEDVMMLPMYPVHEFLGALWAMGQERFAMSCFGPEKHDSLIDFWTHVQHLDWAQRHPVQQKPELLAFTIPAAMFGDEGRFHITSTSTLLWKGIGEFSIKSSKVLFRGKFGSVPELVFQFSRTATKLL